MIVPATPHASHWAAAAAAAEELGAFSAAAALGALALVSFLTYIVALGLHEGWDHTIGWGFRWVANRCRDVGFTVPWVGWHFEPLAPLADFLEWIDGGIAHSLATVALDSEKTAVYLWHLSGIVFWWSVNETKKLALETYHALDYAFTVAVPDAAKWARNEAHRATEWAVNAEAAVRRAENRLLHDALRAVESATTYALHRAEHALDWAEDHVGTLERKSLGWEAKLKQLEHYFTPAAFAGLVIGVLYRELGLQWTQCKANPFRNNKNACGLFGDLSSILGALALALGAYDFDSLVHTAQGLTDGAVKAFEGAMSLNAKDAEKAAADALNALETLFGNSLGL